MLDLLTIIYDICNIAVRLMLAKMTGPENINLGLNLKNITGFLRAEVVSYAWSQLIVGFQKDSRAYNIFYNHFEKSISFGFVDFKL